MKPLMFFVFTLISSLSFGQDSTKVVAIEELEVDHPLLTDDLYKSLLRLDLYDLDDLSKQKEDTVSLLFTSMGYYLKKDTCMKSVKRDYLLKSLDSLQTSYNKFLWHAQEADYLSFGDGHRAGFNSLAFKVFMQENFIMFLKHWFGTWYYTYLEPGVFECHKQE